MSSPGPSYPDLLPDHGRSRHEAIHRRPCYRCPDGIDRHPGIVGQPNRLRPLRRAGELSAGARVRGEVRVTTLGAICVYASATLVGVTR